MEGEGEVEEKKKKRERETDREIYVHIHASLCILSVFINKKKNGTFVLKASTILKLGNQIKYNYQYLFEL